jgi:hypothetical protein
VTYEGSEGIPLRISDWGRGIKRLKKWSGGVLETDVRSQNSEDRITPQRRRERREKIYMSKIKNLKAKNPKSEI